MDSIKLFIGNQFLTAFSRLPQKIQTKARQFFPDFRKNSKSSAIHYETISGARDKRMRSVRIDQNYRGILLDAGKNTFIILWIDQHDEAYRWAKNKEPSINPNTGAIQFIDSETVIASTAEQREDQQEETYLFEKFRDRELMRLGIPEIQIPYIRLIKNIPDLNSKLEKFSSDVAEVLSFLANGFTIEEIDRELMSISQEEAIDQDDLSSAIERDVNKQSYTLITEDSTLEKILDYPLEKWRVFLHPSQSKLISQDYSGPYRVLGGAGTGKTVVALHRAKYLASKLIEENSAAKILFTTFSKNLALNIHKNLSKICSLKELSKIEVINLDAWANEFLKTQGRDFKVLQKKDSDEIWNSLYHESTLERSLEFLKWEWEKIVQHNGIHTLEEYLHISRVGVGTPLNRKERLKVWQFFEKYRALLNERSLLEYDDVIREARKKIEEENIENLYKYILVDEAQDFSVNAFQLIARMISCNKEPGKNSLFIVGDSQQRIYGRKVVLKHCGIPIQGRSKILRLNYRTTEEIGSYATGLLKDFSADNLDGEAPGKMNCLSLTHGEDPVFFSGSNFQSEIEKIKEHIENLQQSGASKEGICICLRTNKLLGKYQAGLEALGIETVEINLQEENQQKGIRISTMHRVKGLEFDHVILAGASKTNIPNNYVINIAPTKIEKTEIEKSEKSLLYVTLSRARKSLAISYYGELSVLLG